MFRLTLFRRLLYVLPVGSTVESPQVAAAALRWTAGSSLESHNSLSPARRLPRHLPQVVFARGTSFSQTAAPAHASGGRNRCARAASTSSTTLATACPSATPPRPSCSAVRPVGACGMHAAVDSPEGSLRWMNSARTRHVEWAAGCGRTAALRPRPAPTRGTVMRKGFCALRGRCWLTQSDPAWCMQSHSLCAYAEPSTPSTAAHAHPLETSARGIIRAGGR